MPTSAFRSPPLFAVLVRTESSGNIGAAARAVANMGGQGLILLQPQCTIDEAARMAAAGAQETLAQAEIFDTWESLLKAHASGFYWALTRRSGLHRPTTSVDVAVARFLDGSLTLSTPIYLVFGPEAHGLANEDLERAHCAVSLEVFGSFGSLNLAQAVLMALYQVQREFHSTHSTNPLDQEGSQPVALASDLPRFEQLLKDWLAAMGLDWQKRRGSALKALRRAFLASHPTYWDQQILESLFRTSLQRMKAAKDEKSSPTSS